MQNENALPYGRVRQVVSHPHIGQKWTHTTKKSPQNHHLFKKFSALRATFSFFGYIRLNSPSRNNYWKPQNLFLKIFDPGSSPEWDRLFKIKEIARTPQFRFFLNFSTIAKNSN